MVKDSLRTALAEELRSIRTQRRFTQEDVAVRLGISRVAVTNYENCKRDIPIDVFIRYCDICGVDAYEILKKVQNYVYK